MLNKKLLLLASIIAATALVANIYAQGCVAIRANSTCGGGLGSTLNLSKGEFNLLAGARYFKSFRHFRGDVQEHHRLDEGTEVINHSAFLDVALNYGVSDRLYLNLVLPVVFHHRSSMYEHGGNPPNGLGDRHATASRGLSDIRLGVGYWLFDPQKHDFNYAIGLGLKLPTGKYDYEDTFYNQGPDRNETIDRVVDQSIQPGDGGLGITFDLLGYHPISHRLGIATNLYYLFSFQETNGVLTRNGQSEFSCADQFAARTGIFYNTMNGLNMYLGARAEGVPAKDLLGSSAGYRRPGYAISVEPGIGYNHNQYSFFASVPLALYRNRTQSYIDQERTQSSGTYRHGDAAFADYLINLSVSYRFGGAHGAMPMPVPAFN